MTSRDVALPESIEVIDSHTEGEPTRVVVDGWPAPEGDTLAKRRTFMNEHQDALRRAVVHEPRGHEAMVGALLTPPVTDGAEAGVVFFNNVGYLDMCGHGLIGVVRTLESMGRITPGDVVIDTPPGPVRARLEPSGHVTFANVPCRVHALDVVIEVRGNAFTGDVAYGGNWFFIAGAPTNEPLTIQRIPELLALTDDIMRALVDDAITGEDGAEIDHVELFSPPVYEGSNCRTFVRCPGGEYDRSPCGTGTSAKLAVLHAREQIAPGATWVQESVTGGRFTSWFVEHDGALIPHIQGRAFVTSNATLRFDARDFLRGGFSPAADRDGPASPATDAPSGMADAT